MRAALNRAPIGVCRCKDPGPVDVWVILILSKNLAHHVSPPYISVLSFEFPGDITIRRSLLAKTRIGQPRKSQPILGHYREIKWTTWRVFIRGLSPWARYCLISDRPLSVYGGITAYGLPPLRARSGPASSHPRCNTQARLRSPVYAWSLGAPIGRSLLIEADLG